jgi:hypothetical protein
LKRFSAGRGPMMWRRTPQCRRKRGRASIAYVQFLHVCCRYGRRTHHPLHRRRDRLVRG